MSKKTLKKQKKYQRACQEKLKSGLIPMPDGSWGKPTNTANEQAVRGAQR